MTEREKEIKRGLKRNEGNNAQYITDLRYLLERVRHLEGVLDRLTNQSVIGPFTVEWIRVALAWEPRGD